MEKQGDERSADGLGSFESGSFIFAVGLPGAFSTFLRLDWADLKEIDRKERKRGRRKRKYTERFC